ncbi:MAG: zinc dependent phospholipase C family protein, partial [Clostridia bacterium]|nr:zinc dependent phospholipase C family protein [Clostridia bacterium]
MKRTIQKLVSLLLVVITCFSLLPTDAFAWGKMTHVYTANLIKKDSDDGSSSVFFGEEEGEKTFRYTVPEEYLEAIREYPDAFRAGALGPDMYPDIITGQTYIHPEDENIDSGEWVTLLCDAVNKMGKDTPGRKQALSFTLGCMLHYCGDLFGHDFVNTYSGGTFPSLFSSDILDLKGERINNILSHLSVEKYMDSLLYPDYDESDGKIDAPDSFVTNAMVFNGTPAAGLAAPYAKYPAFEISLDEVESETVKKALEELFGTDSNNVPPHYTALLALREYVTSVADEYRENMEPVSAAITAYCDAWADDVDRGIVAFTRACDNIARRMVTREKNPDIEKKKQEAVDDEKNYFIKLLQDPDVMFFWDKISKEQN